MIVENAKIIEVINQEIQIAYKGIQVNKVKIDIFEDIIKKQNMKNIKIKKYIEKILNCLLN